MRSAVILAGGKSSRMNKDKGLTLLDGKPLIKYVIKRVKPLVDEVIIVVGDNDQMKTYEDMFSEEDVYIIVDDYYSVSPLVGAITGFKKAKGKYALLTGCDMPFIHPEAVEYLFQSAKGFNGATYQWSNGWIEPLLAVYHVKSSQLIMMELHSKGDKRLRMVICYLSNVNMIPMDQLKKIDNDLFTFYNINTIEQLKKAEKLLKKLV